MSGFAFQLAIGAKDETQGALRSVLLGFSKLALKPITIPLKIATGGLGILRDVNLGLRPLVAGLDNLIERGSALEVVRKSFDSLTGVTGAKSDRLARQIQNATSGTLRLAEGMEIANRALGSGLNFNQLTTAIEFIGKKSVTTGKNAREALNTVITGLSRGSTLFLDDFGILVDGIEGVKRSFDGIKGAGAFDSLGPAAQKTETIRQAIAEMQQQMGRIGVTGKETIFQWQSIKNAIGDATDKLVLAVAKSDALKQGLTGFRDLLGGITEHFEHGGKITDVLFGKGKSGGFLGVVKGVALDIGEALGRGIVGGLLKGIGSVPELWGEAKDFILGQLMPDTGLDRATRKIMDLPAFAGVDERLHRTAKEITRPGASFTERTMRGSLQMAGAHAQFAKNVLGDPIHHPLQSFGGTTASLAMIPGHYLARLIKWLFGRDDLKDKAKGQVGMLGLPNSMTMALARIPSMAAMGGATPFKMSDALSTTKTSPIGFFAQLKQRGEDILSGGIMGNEPSRTRVAWNALYKDFPFKSPKEDSYAMGLERWNKFPEAYRNRLELSAATRRRMAGQTRVDEAAIGNIEHGGGGARQAALRATGADIAVLRREGYSVSPSDRRAIFNEELRREIAERTEGRRNNLGGRKQQLEEDENTRFAHWLDRKNVGRDPVHGDFLRGEALRKAKEAYREQQENREIIKTMSDSVVALKSIAESMKADKGEKGQIRDLTSVLGEVATALVGGQRRIQRATK